MKARVGDELIVRGLHVGDADRRGVITEVHGEDGSPPYLVRWADGHESSFFPSSGTEVEHIPLPAGKGATTALWGYRGLAAWADRRRWPAGAGRRRWPAKVVLTAAAARAVPGLAPGNRKRTYAPYGAVSRSSSLRSSSERKRGHTGARGEEVMMTTARDIMHVGAECIGEHETLTHAAQRMRDLDVGALPVCGDDDRLHGIITDRDIVLKCVAAGRDPQTVTAGDLAQGKPFTVDAGADVTQVLRMMEDHKIRRLPVTDSHRLVGMISEADLARHLPDESVAEFVETICASS